jgi:polysaccharide export outer membrane protein
MIKRYLLLAAILAGGLHGQQAHATDTNDVTWRQTVENMDLLDDHQKIGPGDRLTYRVIEDQDDPRSLIVADSGEVEVPYYGLIRAKGKTSLELARELKGLLEERLYYRATVIIAVEVVNMTRVNGKVYVTGQVRNRGGYDIPASEDYTVSKAILSAGGFSDFSDKKNVRLIRKTPAGKKTFLINVVDVWEKGKLEKDMSVQADDLIVVPARLINY